MRFCEILAFILFALAAVLLLVRRDDLALAVLLIAAGLAVAAAPAAFQLT